MKYLSVLINEFLSWNKQIDNTCSKLSRANRISKWRHFLLANFAFLFILSFIFYYSHLLHGCLVWSYSKQSHIDRISKLQKCCVRIFSFSDFNDQSNGLFFEIELLEIADIFKMQKIIFMFDFLNNNVPDELKTLSKINASTGSYETRSSQIFHIPKARTSKSGINSLTYGRKSEVLVLFWTRLC